MAGYLHCCTLLKLWLVALLTGLALGTINIARPACRTDSIPLINMFQVDCDNTTWSLYKKNILITVWTMQNSVPTATFINGYRDKFFLDKFRNIWILDIQSSDEAIYSIRCPTGNATKKYEVKLDVLVEPETRCKPKIIRGVDTLTTYLEPDGCGKPAGSAYWLEQPGISVVDNVIKLQPGQEAGTVYACIDSPSLKCAKNSKLSDHCTVFKDESKIQTKLSEISGVSTANLVITTLLNGFVIVMAIVFYRRHLVMQNKSKLSECNFCKTKRIASYIAGTQPLDAELKWEGVDEGHKERTEEPVLPQKKLTENTTPPQVHEITIPQSEEEDTANDITKHLLDDDHEIKEATTEHQSSTNAEAIQELRELRDDAICKICYCRKKSMMFMPCNHLATCVNCGIALQQCPVCRALIEEKRNIRF